jgi:hypothetical protein
LSADLLTLRRSNQAISQKNDLLLEVHLAARCGD